jgi:predicted permease
MIRWSYGYRYLLAPERDISDVETTPLLTRAITMESDENTPLYRSSPTPTPSEEYDSSPALQPSAPHSLDGDLTSLPPPSTHPLLSNRLVPFLRFVWKEFLEFMNMPLWAMLVSILVALFPGLQHHLFFKKNGFIRGSVIYAIRTCGDVSIPLILVILGANLANKDVHVPEEHQHETTDPKVPLSRRNKAIILAILTRMVIVPVRTPGI